MISIEFLIIVAAGAAVALYLFNSRIVEKPRLDMFLAFATWMAVYFVFLFLFAVTVDLMWILLIVVFTVMATLPYADFMRGLACTMLALGVYCASFGAISSGIVMMITSMIEVVNKCNEMVNFMECRNGKAHGR